MLARAQDNGTSIREAFVRSLLDRTKSNAPWSPLSVAVITFILPAGGAVLTVHNLARIQGGDNSQVRRQTVGIVLLFALGLAIILALAPVQSNGAPRLDTDTYTVVQFGVAVAAYVVQRAPFRAWHQSHVVRPSAWTTGVLTALIYQFLAILATVPIYAGVAVLAASRFAGS